MPISLWCILAAYLTIFIPRVMVARAQARVDGRYDNDDPRDQQARVDQRGRRAAAAHQNGFESFAPFAAAVLVAHAAGGAQATANWLALAYIGARIVYPFVYVSGRGNLRSLVWGVGFLATLALFSLPARG